MIRTEEDLRAVLSACEEVAPDPLAVRLGAERTAARHRRHRMAGLAAAGILAIGAATAAPDMMRQVTDRPAPTEVDHEVSADVALPPGTVARLWIPRLDRRWAVVDGVTADALRHAPGHYVDSAMPGQPGNVAVAGHCSATQFGDVDLLEPGDAIFLADTETWYEYRVTEVKLVATSAVGVVAPVPGTPGAVPTQSYLTLTTCHPARGDSTRVVVHATLAGPPTWTADGRPPQPAN